MFGVAHYHPHTAWGLIEKLLPALHHQFGRRNTASSGEDICHDTTHRCCQNIVSRKATARNVDLDSARNHSMACSLARHRVPKSPREIEGAFLICPPSLNFAKCQALYTFVLASYIFRSTRQCKWT